jgi:ribosome biogenesis GTPase
VSSRERLGWNPFFDAQAASLARPDLRFARVVEEQRGLYRLGGDDGWAEVSGRFRHEAHDAAAFPTVGDWVGVRNDIIHCVLERRSAIARAAAGRASREQLIAANVDTIFLVTALPQDLNARRLERYLTMVWDGGAVPVVVVNKADLSGDPDAARTALAARLPLVDIVVTSALAGSGVDALAPWLRPAQTVALAGSSGVGKSTLINRLLGRDMLRTGAIGDEDGRGRHTTTARQLVELPGGALLIDTPGMRELQPWTGDGAVEAAFHDIAGLAEGCRFGDCAHQGEPGCAVLAAVESGALDADRLEHYRRLLREAAYEERRHDKAAAAEHKRRWKQIHQANKVMYRERDRG